MDDEIWQPVIVQHVESVELAIDRDESPAWLLELLAQEFGGDLQRRGA